jgi:broad specificity phosphatase PhoE
VQLIIVRHACPQEQRATAGRADPALSGSGDAQAERLAEFLRQEPIDRIVSSRLLRARQTATPLSLRLGVYVAIDDDLVEYDESARNYIPTQDLAAKDPERWEQLLRRELPPL